MSAFPSNTLQSEFFSLITDETPHLALYTSDPTAANTGTEVTGGSYSRQPITFGTPVNGVVSNSASINFPELPANTITHYGIVDAANDGDLKVYGDIADIATQTGDEINVAVGSLVVTFAGS